MKKLTLLFASAVLAWSCRAAETSPFARSRASYSNQLAQVEADCRAKEGRIAAQYAKALKQLEDTYRSRGHLEALLATQKEAGRFEGAGTIDTPDLVREPAQLARLQGQCRAALDRATAARDKSASDLRAGFVLHLRELQKSLTVKGAFDEAIRIKEFLDELEPAKPEGPVAPAPADGAAGLRRGFLAHYDFEGLQSAALEDRSGNGRHAVLRGGSLERVTGSRGQVLVLDGRQDGFDTPLRVGDLPVTIAIWYRRGERTGLPGYIFGFHEQRGRRFYLGIDSGSGDLGIGLGDLTMAREGYGLPRDSEWHHCVVVYDPPAMTLFFDGVRVAAKSSEAVTDGNLSFGYGRHYKAEGGPLLFVNGAMDDVMIFDRALSESDVGRLFQETGGIPARTAAVEHLLRNRKPDDGASAHGGHRYKLFRASCSWHAARARCENMGGHLATISSEAEHAFVAELCGETRAWIGGTDEGTPGRWVWVTGHKLAFPSWARPSISKSWGEHYLTIRNGSWSDHPVKGSSVTGFVCEWEKKSSNGSAE